MYQWLTRDVNVKESLKAVTGFVKYRMLRIVTEGGN
jgi:hypothetical protein